MTNTTEIEKKELEMVWNTLSSALNEIFYANGFKPTPTYKELLKVAKKINYLRSELDN